MLTAAVCLVASATLLVGGVRAADMTTAEFRPVDTAGACTPLPDLRAMENGTPFSLDVTYGEDPADVELDETVVVSPTAVRVDRPLAAGDTFTCEVTVRNRRAKRTTYRIETSGARGSHSTRAGVEFVDPDGPDAADTAGSWLEPVVDEVTLDPRQYARIPVQVTVPADPPVGSAAATLDVVSGDTADTGTGAAVGIESVAAVLFTFRVGGEGRQDLQLGDVRAPRLRIDRDPWTLRANLDNEGTLLAIPRGRVRIRSIFGTTVRELPVATSPLLPGGRARVETTWNGVPWFGIYRYDVRVTAGDGDDAGAPARAKGWFVALPPIWVLVLVGVVLLAIILGAWWRRRAERTWEDDADEITGDGDFDSASEDGLGVGQG